MVIERLDRRKSTGYITFLSISISFNTLSHLLINPVVNALHMAFWSFLGASEEHLYPHLQIFFQHSILFSFLNFYILNPEILRPFDLFQGLWRPHRVSGSTFKQISHYKSSFCQASCPSHMGLAFPRAHWLACSVGHGGQCLNPLASFMVSDLETSSSSSLR